MLSDLSWTHTIEDILIYVDNYIKVLKYLKYQNFEILDVNLENFTKQTEQSSKKIFEFCNLTWSKDIFNFYQRKDLYSKTLSFKQIRSKISLYNDDKYKPYVNLLSKYKDKYEWLNF